MKPTCYARTPEPQISRRFKDQDPGGRLAADILERASSYIFEKANLDAALRSARDDMLLPGRGTIWVRFIKDGELATDYIHWRDFLHNPARRWEEVTWVAKRAYLTKDTFQLRFPGCDLKGKSPDNIPKSGGITEEERKTLEGKFSVWEIWDKLTGRVCWIAPTQSEPCEVSEVPILNLESFWPCPKPLYATTTTDSLIPVPDYKYYQDQSEEIDDLTRRIASLTDSLKVVGFYPRGAENTTEIEKALDPSVENRMIGVDSWAAFADKGGGNAIIFLPIDQVVKTIQACVELRKQLIEDVYQITGLSDIMRGATDPDETATAQSLKAQTGSIRVRDRQQEIQRFARDALRIMTEIIAEKFSPETLLTMTNMATRDMATPEGKENLMQAFQILQNDKLRGFRVDIETDSTVQLDENAEKQRRVEFATAVGGLMQQAIPMAQQVPELIPLVGQTLQFVVRGFRAGRELEDTIDKTMKTLEQKAAQAAMQPQEDPKIAFDRERMMQVEKPKADADAALANARASQIGMQTQLEPQKLAMAQDEMFLGERARQEERQDGLQNQQADREAAEAERQDGLYQTEIENTQAENQRQDALQAQAVERGDALRADTLDRNERAQAAAAAGPGGPAGSGAAPRPGAAPGGAQAGVGMVAQLLQQLAASTQQNSQAIAQLAQVMASPTVVDTPRGQYVARKALN
jgi:hypothetical protein